MNRTTSRVALGLFVLEVALVPLSWLLSAWLPGSGVRSLLGSEGVRWFLGRYADMLASPLLVWLLLLSMSAGCLRRCGLLPALRSLFRGRVGGGVRPLHYRERVALRFALAVAVGFVAVMSVLAFAPHAVLLSATGSLFPSPLSASLIPATAFCVILMSVVYGLVADRYRGITDVCESLAVGIASASPLFLYYILLIQLYYSVAFVFG